MSGGEAIRSIDWLGGKIMYYEEKIINGVLMYRSMPDGKWMQCSIEKMGQRIVELEKRVKELSA